MNEWINIKDELPPLNTWVLVYTYQPYDIGEKRRRRETSYRYKMDNCDIERFACEERIYGWKVTHWMPLPIPPVI